MEKWILFAIISALFAGCTSVIAKAGLNGISGELGLLIRTCFVFAFVLLFGLFRVPANELSHLSRTNYVWLALSGLTTTASWIFYYKALKLGNVSTIAIIDKGSIIVAVLLAWLFLREQITPRIALGCAFVLFGLILVSRK